MKRYGPLPGPPLPAVRPEARLGGQVPPHRAPRMDPRLRRAPRADGRGFPVSRFPEGRSGARGTTIRSPVSGPRRRRRRAKAAPAASGEGKGTGAGKFLRGAIARLEDSLADPPPEGAEARATALAVRHFRLGGRLRARCWISPASTGSGAPRWVALGCGEPLARGPPRSDGGAARRFERVRGQGASPAVGSRDRRPGVLVEERRRAGRLPERLVRPGVPAAGLHRRGAAPAPRSALPPNRCWEWTTSSTSTDRDDAVRLLAGAIESRRSVPPAVPRQGGNREDRVLEDPGPRRRRPPLRPRRTGSPPPAGGKRARTGTSAAPRRTATGCGWRRRCSAASPDAVLLCDEIEDVLSLGRRAAGARTTGCWRRRPFRSSSPATTSRDTTRPCSAASIWRSASRC